MDIGEVQAVVAGLPWMAPDQGKVVYDFILRAQPEHVLELGFMHGVSTCYMAAALHELGRGRILTMDKPSALDLTPALPGLLTTLGLEEYVAVAVNERGYNEELLSLIEARTAGNAGCEPLFDFSYIDGSHLWETDGLGFFLVEMLTRPGGTILFDDLDWCLAHSPSLQNAAWVRALSHSERAFKHMDAVFRLLVTPHANIEQTVVTGNWGWATKKR